jgi:hypothetical protein
VEIFQAHRHSRQKPQPPRLRAASVSRPAIATAFYTGLVAAPDPSLQLVEETIEKQLDAQIGHIDALDTKAGILLGFLAVTLASVIANKDVAEIVGKSTLVKCAVGAILLAFLLSMAAFAIREYATSSASLYP